MGGFGKIFKGRLRDGTKVAIKVFKENSTQAHLPSIQMASKRVRFFSCNEVLSAHQETRCLGTTELLVQRFANEVFISSVCGTIRHENIMQFMGVVIKEGLGAGLILLWSENGDSLAYVKKQPDVRRLPIVSSLFFPVFHFLVLKECLL